MLKANYFLTTPLAPPSPRVLTHFVNMWSVTTVKQKPVLSKISPIVMVCFPQSVYDIVQLLSV